MWKPPGLWAFVLTFLSQTFSKPPPTTSPEQLRSLQDTGWRQIGKWRLKTKAGAPLLMQGNLCHAQAPGGFEVDRRVGTQSSGARRIYADIYSLVPWWLRW